MLIDRYEAVVREVCALKGEDRLAFSRALASRLKGLAEDDQWAFIVELGDEIERLKARPGFPVDPAEWEMRTVEGTEPPAGGEWLLLHAVPLLGTHSVVWGCVWVRRRKKETLTAWLDKGNEP